jgi:dTDP-4-dehydrorhamnose 3,5-epimerase-like enzyme
MKEFSADLPDVPTIYPGACSIDDRGELSYVNGFPLDKFKRFYTVSNHSKNFVRAWHGHMLESKVFFVLKGSILACAVKMTDTISPDTNQIVERKVLSSKSPAGFFIPPGYANGFMSLTNDAQLIVFSNTTLAESQGDDYRFPFDYWDPWEIVPR